VETSRINVGHADVARPELIDEGAIDRHVADAVRDEIAAGGENSPCIVEVEHMRGDSSPTLCA
jgi:hypothetical protein